MEPSRLGRDGAAPRVAQQQGHGALPAQGTGQRWLAPGGMLAAVAWVH